MIDRIKKVLTGKNSRVIMILSFTFFLVKGLIWLAIAFYSMYLGYTFWD